MFASAFLAFDPRLVVWAVVVVAWIVGIVLVGRSAVGFNLGLPPTESLVERFGLFTIIVLGEFVFGVVDGLSLPDRDVLTITTGMIALVIGFGFWWIYFDLVGRRLPRGGGRAQASWLLSHLPITMAITAAGAAMVSLIGHAHDAAHAGEHGVVALGRRRVGPARPDRHRAHARRRRPPRDRLPPARCGAGRGSSRRPRRRWSAPGAVAPRVAARGHPLGAVVLRRQPVPARRRLGRGRVPPRTDTLDRGVPDGVEYVIIVCRRAHPARHNPGLHIVAPCRCARRERSG